MSIARDTRGAVRRLASVLALGTLSLGLTACGAGFESQTYEQRNVGDGTNAAAGGVAIRNVTIPAPEEGIVHEEGQDVRVLLTLANDGAEDDRLVEASSPAAASVGFVQSGRAVPAVPLPRLSTTGGTVELVLRDLQEEVRSGEYVDVTLRFERGGSVTAPVPVATREEREPRPISSNFVHEEEAGH